MDDLDIITLYKVIMLNFENVYFTKRTNFNFLILKLTGMLNFYQDFITLS